jgi:hypothetical protein
VSPEIAIERDRLKAEVATLLKQITQLKVRIVVLEETSVEYENLRKLFVKQRDERDRFKQGAGTHGQSYRGAR